MLYYTILYYTIVYYTILYYTIRYDTILYDTILYYTQLYCTVLYCTILYDRIRYYGRRPRPGRAASAPSPAASGRPVQIMIYYMDYIVLQLLHSLQRVMLCYSIICDARVYHIIVYYGVAYYAT